MGALFFAPFLGADWARRGDFAAVDFFPSGLLSVMNQYEAYRISTTDILAPRQFPRTWSTIVKREQ
jgi:hypothetical protein